MPDYSVILQTPQIRSLVQEKILERAFHEAMFPRLLFRAEAAEVEWPANVGDSQVFTGVGLMKPKLKPLAPGVDPVPSDYEKEQWEATLQQYADSIDTHMPTSVNAIANLFLRNANQLGLSAGQTLNRVVRNRLYNAAEAGHTVADGAQGPVATLRVKRLNGFTKARRPDLANGSPVRFATVSGNNPLTIQIYDTAGPAFVTREVTSYTADNVGDEYGPGTITFTGGNVTVLDRAAVIANNRTYLVRVGGGYKIDDVGTSDTLRLQDLRAAIARFWTVNAAEMPDGRFHCHLDPTSQAQVFQDDEFQRLLTALPDHFMYRQFALGELLGTVYFRNSECPQVETVGDGNPAVYTTDDPFAGELTNNGGATGVRVHRALLISQAAVFEYYQALDQLITEAGVTGKVGEATPSSNGIEIAADRIQLIIRAPLNRLQDKVSTSWKFIGDWPVRTDVTVGDAAAFKRMCLVQHGEA